jgi:hypothetical protein
MLKSAAASLVIILSLFCILVLSAKSTPAEPVPEQTGTAVDNPNALAPVLPDEKACASYINAAIEKQWLMANAELLRSLSRSQQFTELDRKALVAHEKGLSPRQKYYLRIAVLNQLIGR